MTSRAFRKKAAAGTLSTLLESEIFGPTVFWGNYSRLILTQVHIPFGTLLKDPKKWAAACVAAGSIFIACHLWESGVWPRSLKRGTKKGPHDPPSFGTRKTHPFGCLAAFFFRRAKGVAVWRGWWLWMAEPGFHKSHEIPYHEVLLPIAQTRNVWYLCV